MASKNLQRTLALQATRSYWNEARDFLHRGRDLLGRAADLPPATAVPVMQEARTHLYDGSEWLAHLAEGLVKASRAVELAPAREVVGEPERSFDLDLQ